MRNFDSPFLSLLFYKRLIMNNPGSHFTNNNFLFLDETNQKETKRHSRPSREISNPFNDDEKDEASYQPDAGEMLGASLCHYIRC